MQQNHSYIAILSAELQRYVMEEMLLCDLISFSNTRKENRDGITNYIAMRQRNLFLQFSKDVSTFIGLLDHTGSVVSGSCALNLLQAERNAVIPQDMDIYTTKRFQTEVLDHLKNREGY